MRFFSNPITCNRGVVALFNVHSSGTLALFGRVINIGILSSLSDFVHAGVLRRLPTRRGCRRLGSGFRGLVRTGAGVSGIGRRVTRLRPVGTLARRLGRVSVHVIRVRRRGDITTC